MSRPAGLRKARAIFEGPTTEAEARARMAELKRYVARNENDDHTKSIHFLDDNFKNWSAHNQPNLAASSR
jgi:hypothetical protein